ncbi:MAG: hypothetical protein ACOYJU_05235 [Anaerovoracaceae bacterium]|jgi:hypothetical protein
MTIQKMILIGSTSQNSGKTQFGTELTRRLSRNFPVVVLKVATVHKKGMPCVRGKDGCGICTRFTGDYQLIEERSYTADTDTAKYLKAGAQKAYLLKCLKSHLAEAYREFLDLVPEDAIILCESNSLREVWAPDYFVMLRGRGKVKPSARQVMALADQVVKNDYQTDFSSEIDKILTVDKSRRINVPMIRRGRRKESLGAIR